MKVFTSYVTRGDVSLSGYSKIRVKIKFMYACMYDLKP